MSLRPPPETCANCGADIPRHARACPECGADERTGWAEQSLYDGLDLPGDDETDSSENGCASRPRRTFGWLWWTVGVLLVIAFALTALGLR